MSAGAKDAPLTYEGEYDPTRTYLPRQLVKVGTTPYLSLAKQAGVDPPGASWLAFGGGASYGMRYHSWGGQAVGANDGLSSVDINPVPFADPADDLQGAGATMITYDPLSGDFTVAEAGIYTAHVLASAVGLREGQSWFGYLRHSQSFLNIIDTGIGTGPDAISAPPNWIELVIPPTQFGVGDQFSLRLGFEDLDATSPNAFGSNPTVSDAEIVLQRVPG